MSTIETVKCDVCGVLKGDTNHWWKIRRNPGGSLLIAPAGNNIAGEDCCGASCVQKKVNEFCEATNGQVRSAVNAA